MDNKKATATIALPLALAGMPLIASAASSTGPVTSAKQITVTTGNVSNLSEDVEIQLSEGVAITVANTGSGQDVAVATCHEGGNTSFEGDTSGGAVTKTGDISNVNNCATGNMTADNADSS